jgi:CDP-diacylglycerol pyrophosphatase
MPRSRVTGIEDPRRPEAIWPFAWRVAREHIPEEREVALVLNPASARTQNQMHVHIVRLTGDGRRLVDRPPPESARMKVGSLPDLSAVFAGVAGVVGTSAIGKQGVLIARAAAGDGWTMLLLENRSPEVYTEGSCRH